MKKYCLYLLDKETSISCYIAHYDNFPDALFKKLKEIETDKIGFLVHYQTINF